MAQRLTPGARKRKAARDLEYANSARRRRMRAENQRLRRAARRAGRDISGMDYDHKDKKFKTVKRNRGNDGRGTKKEG